jgi:regulator of replication initiation timing
MGLYTVQAANLSDWKGDVEHAEWKKLCREVEHKLTPLWVKRQIAEMEAELVAERARLAGAQSREKVLQAQIVKEVQAQGDLKQQCDKAVDEATSLRATVEELRRARSEAETHAVELSQSLREAEAQQLAALKQERDKAVDEATSLKATVEELRRARSEAETGPAMLSQPLSETARQQSGISFGGEKLGRRAPLAMICGGASIFLGMILGNGYEVLFWVVGLILVLSGFVMSVIGEAKRK